jgi:DNA-directed RNA polymerase subunit omega
MARITVEDCLKQVNNRFTLIHAASKRVRQLRKGAEPTVSAKNRDIVIALREIAAGNVKSVKGDGTTKSHDTQDTFFSEDLFPEKE